MTTDNTDSELRTMYVSANDNIRHPRLDEFLYWQKKYDGKNRFPKTIFKQPFDIWDRSLSNFVWFYKFEISWRENNAKELRRKMEVLK